MLLYSNFLAKFLHSEIIQYTADTFFHLFSCTVKPVLSIITFFPERFQGVAPNRFQCLCFAMSDRVSLPLISNCGSRQHLPDGLPNLMEILQHTFHILVHLTVLPIHRKSAPVKNCTSIVYPPFLTKTITHSNLQGEHRQMLQTMMSLV